MLSRQLPKFLASLVVAATLSLPAAASAKPWKGAEVISSQTFRYGAFEARFKAAPGGGVITPFFLWKDGSENPGAQWQEQDFEVFGRDGTFQTQAMTPGDPRTEHVVVHYPAVPAYDVYNTYRMEWTPDSLCYYFNGRLVRKETDRVEYAKLLDPARTEPMQLRISNWAGDFEWSGAFDQGAMPSDVYVNWISTYSYTPGSGPGGSNFTPLWRDDFNTWNSSRWWKANWTFEFAVNDYVPENAAVRNGYLALALTHYSQTGVFRTPPTDNGDATIVTQVPGTIHSQRFNLALDDSPGNRADQRCLSASPDVDLLYASDLGESKCYVGYTAPGEFLEYQINAQQEFLADVVVTAATGWNNQTFQLELNGNVVGGTQVVNAVDWEVWAPTTLRSVAIPAGSSRLRIIFGTGNVNFKSIAIVPAAPAPPSKVEGLAAVAGDRQVSLSWNASSGATTYKVVRGTDTVSVVSEPSFIDNGLDNGTEYTYRVVASNSAGNAEPSADVLATPIAPEPPSAPTGLAALAGNAVVSLAWSPVEAATAYKVYRSIDGTNFTPLATVVDAQYSDASVTNGTVYTYRVTALRGSLESVPSSSVDAAPRGEAPLQVTGLVATPADAKVTLTWTASAGAETYTIYRGVEGATAVVLTVVSSASYEDVAVANGSTYAYTVVASNTWGDAPMSAQVTAIPLAYPDVPSALVATATDSRIDLVWLGGANTESFKVYRTASSGPKVLIATVATPSYSDLAVVNGTTYAYSVTAVNSTLESAHSELVTARPVGAVPEQVTGLIATANDATVALTWNNSVGASSYKVMRSAGAGVATLVGTSLSASFTDATVSNGTVYSYSVVASNEWGDAVASDIVTATPDFAVPGVPSSLSALADNGRVTLAWTAGANNASFKIYRATAGGAAILLATSSQAAYVDVTVANGTTYTYTVAGVNGTKESAVSNAAIAEPRGVAPSQVTGLVATAGNATVALSWSASPLATVYKVVRGTDTVARIASASYTDNAVVNGTTYSYAVVASNTWGNAPVSVSVSAKPTAPTAGLKAQYKAGTVGATTNGIRPLLQIVNTGSAPVALSKVTVRYWFTNNGTQSVSYWCDWAQIGSANLTGTVKTVSPARTKADRYLEIAFKTSAGNLSAGGSTGEIQSRFSKSDWTNFTQTDDASYDPTKASSYADWNKVTVYYEGALVWGVEP